MSPVNYQAVIFDLFGTLVRGFSHAELEAALIQMADRLAASWRTPPRRR